MKLVVADGSYCGTVRVQPVPALSHAWTTTKFHLVRVGAQRSGSGPDAATEVVITWQSAADKRYHIWWTPDLRTAFSRIASELPATPPENTFTHQAAGSGSGYYQIEIAPTTEPSR